MHYGQQFLVILILHNTAILCCTTFPSRCHKACTGHHHHWTPPQLTITSSQWQWFKYYTWILGSSTLCIALAYSLQRPQSIFHDIQARNPVPQVGFQTLRKKPKPSRSFIIKAVCHLCQKTSLPDKLAAYAPDISTVVKGNGNVASLE